MSDPLTVSDIQGGTKLEAESLDEDDVDSVMLTIDPGGRTAARQSIGLHRQAEEELAGFLLEDLVDEEPSAIALKPEDHRVLADLGISRREDGRWGYKLTCAHRRCGQDAPACYCADGVLEAVRDASTRSSKHPCSALCAICDGFGDWLQDVVLNESLEEWLEEALDRTAAELHREIHPGASGDAGEDRDYLEVLGDLAWNRSREHRREHIDDLWDEVNEYLQSAVGDTVSDDEMNRGREPDMNECACPTGGGS